ncbi:hypothetical protein RRG08_027462 [Elysia crispata]|uniref:Uncharacterized protein n=1 Tax=Elysia crispata TaxID=231223 RepID=A0AAE0YRF7_9GAST|nr:hypothetical protein RRG08_027462 [Elysia crispata]
MLRHQFMIVKEIPCELSIVISSSTLYSGLLSRNTRKDKESEDEKFQKTTVPEHSIPNTNVKEIADELRNDANCSLHCGIVSTAEVASYITPVPFYTDHRLQPVKHSLLIIVVGGWKLTTHAGGGFASPDSPKTMILTRTSQTPAKRILAPSFPLSSGNQMLKSKLRKHKQCSRYARSAANDSPVAMLIQPRFSNPPCQQTAT